MDLMAAVMADDVEAANENARMVELLLKAGPDIDIPDRHGTTALLLAAVKGNLEIVDTLLKYMAASKSPASSEGLPQESPPAPNFD